MTLNPHAKEFTSKSHPSKTQSKLNPYAKEFTSKTQSKLNPSAKEFTSKIDPKLIMLHRLLVKKSFRDEFSEFAQNVLCVTDIDFTKMYVNYDMSVDDEYLLRTNSLWLFYVHDGISYKIVYNGSFYQWEHVDDCSGFSCDEKQCHSNYK